MRVLILGGIEEARRIASTLAAAGHEVTTSLAGRTREPVPPVGRVRSGGFGGADALASYVGREGFDLLIDATHPFAGGISTNAAAAARKAGVRRLALRRRPWERTRGDRWEAVAGVDAAAAVLPSGATTLLALGRQHLAPFASRNDVSFIARAIEPFTPPFPCTILMQRPSREVAVEAQLLQHHGITHVVSRNSGGSGAYAKIAAARELDLAVVMIDRPPPPPPPVFGSVEALLDAI